MGINSLEVFQIWNMEGTRDLAYLLTPGLSTQVDEKSILLR